MVRKIRAGQGDYDDLMRQWASAKTSKTVAAWLAEYSKRTHRDLPPLSDELLLKLAHDYDSLLHRASDAVLLLDQEARMADANIVMDLISLVASSGIPDIADAKRCRGILFEKLLEIAKRWALFRVNRSDQSARVREQALLTSILSAADDQEGAAFVKAIEANRKPAFDVRVFDDVLQNIANALKPKTLEALIQRMKQANGIAEILPYEAYPHEKILLATLESEFWTPVGSSPGEVLLGAADSDPIIQDNAIDLLHLIDAITRRGSSSVEPETVRHLIASSDIMKAIWNAAIATPLQFRMLSDFRTLREKLIRLGADERVFAQPAWLVATAELPQQPSADDF